MTTTSPRHRSYRARSDMERKLQLMEQWERIGVPIGYVIPRNVTEFCRWTDPDLGIQAQRKLSLLSPKGKYRDLRLRLDNVQAALNPKLTAEPAPHKSKGFEQALLKQLIVLRQENRSLLADLSIERSTVADLRIQLREKSQRMKKARHAAKNVVALKRPER